MFVLALISHRLEGDKILDSAQQPVSLTSVQNMLSSRNFPAMKGRPKLMIVDSFSGGKHHGTATSTVLPIQNTSFFGSFQILITLMSCLNSHLLLFNKGNFVSYTPNQPIF